MENGYWMVSKVFWQTICRLRRGQWDIAQAVPSKGGETLASTEENVERWKEHFEEVLNPVDTPSFQEAVLESPSEIGSISIVAVATAVKCLCSGKATGVDKIHLEMLKPLDNVGVLWLMCLFNVAQKAGAVPLDCQTGVVVQIFKNGD
ncbi:unnamed protein product [Caretta caretta]